MNITNSRGLAPAIQPLDPLCYSIAEACRVTSLGRTCVFQLIKEGRLETRKIGKRTLVLAPSLRALIEREA